VTTRSSSRTALSFLLALPALGLVLLAVGWVFAHFRDSWRDWLSITYAAAPWLMPIAAVVLLLALLLRARLSMAASAVALLVFAAPFAPARILRLVGSSQKTDGQTIKVMSFNIGSYSLAEFRLGNAYARLNGRALAKLIADSDADLVLLQEAAKPVWDGVGLELAQLPGGSRYRALTAAGFETTLLSRFPARAVFRTTNPMPATHFVVSTPAGEINVWNIHTTRDAVILRGGLRNWTVRPQSRTSVRQQIEWLAGRVEAHGGPTLIGGDFNAPAESTSLAPIAARHVEAHAMAGDWIGFTFPETAHLTGTVTIAGRTIALSSVPRLARIDHVFVSEHFDVREASVGAETVRSDHAPVYATVTLRVTDGGR
jgi:endonuclease/exonuclease/phosphatase family metal-dependent hydrolase